MPGTFVFYDINSRGDAIRALLHHAGEEYKDERFAVADFGPVKESGRFPTQSMPIWEEDGMTVCSTNAILRALGIRLGYYSENP